MIRRVGPPTLKTRLDLGGGPPEGGTAPSRRRRPAALYAARTDLDLRVSRRSDGGWRFDWDAYYPTAVYQVWFEGVLLDTVAGSGFDYLEARVAVNFVDEPPDVEVVPASAVAENSLYPPYQVVQWRGLQGAAGYVVEQWDGASWVPVGNVAEAARGCYWLKTPAQPDGSSARYRVTAYDVLGNGSAPKEYPVAVVCRNPGPPVVSFSVVGGAIVVAAA